MQRVRARRTYEVRGGTGVSSLRQALVQPRRPGVRMPAASRGDLHYTAAIRNVTSESSLNPARNRSGATSSCCRSKSRDTASTPLHSARSSKRLARNLVSPSLGQRRLGEPYHVLLQGPRVSVSAPTLRGLDSPVFGCASTGTCRQRRRAAARLGLQCYVFIPHDLEPNRFSVPRSTADRSSRSKAITTM